MATLMVFLKLTVSRT